MRPSLKRGTNGNIIFGDKMPTISEGGTLYDEAHFTWFNTMACEIYHMIRTHALDTSDVNHPKPDPNPSLLYP